MVAIVVSLVGSAWTIVELAYAYGGINLVSWQFSGLPSFTGNWVARHVQNPEPLQAWHVGLTGLGAVIMGALTYLKGRIVGFPIHPIGLTLGLTHPVNQIWFSVFLAWTVKATVLKYGGIGWYRHLRQLFLGLTLGAFVSAGIWLVIDALTGMSGNAFLMG